MKSPIVRIDLNSHDSEDEGGDLEMSKRSLGGVGAGKLGDQNFSAREHPIGGNDDTAEEHIANMPDIHNESMVGDLNQLINDLNSGNNPSATLNARQRRQAHIAARGGGTSAPNNPSQ